MKVTILPNLSDTKSFSMPRYAKELEISLKSLNSQDNHFESLNFSQSKIFKRLINNKLTERLDAGISRYVTYPFQISKVKSDIFHITDHGYSNIILGLKQSKTVITCHDQIGLLSAEGYLPIAWPAHFKYVFKLRLWCMEKAAHIISVSESTKRDLLRLSKTLNPEKISVIYSGLSKEFTAELNIEKRLLIRRMLNLPINTFLILQVGSSPYKNSTAILKALKLLINDYGLNIYLVKVGSGFSKIEENIIDELGIRTFIIKAGKVHDNNLPKYYQAVDLLVFPSLWEGFGWPPLEAMASGTPVVSSNAGSLPEVVGDAGLMVDPLDYEALAKAINEVLVSTKLNTFLVGRGLDRVKKFTWEHTAKETIAVYERVLGHK